MDCETAKGLLSSYYDEELDPAKHKLVAEHVDMCSACSRELEALAKLDRDSRLLYVPEPPPEIWDRVESRLPVHATRRALSNSFGRRQFLVATGAVAAASVGVFVTSTFNRRRPQKPAVPEVAQPVRHVSIAPSAMLAGVSDLSPEDRRFIQMQRFCANEECNERLGTGNEPIKVVLKNRTVFVCCHECELAVRHHPTTAVAKVDALLYRRLRIIEMGSGH